MWIFDLDEAKKEQALGEGNVRRVVEAEVKLILTGKLLPEVDGQQL